MDIYNSVAYAMSRLLTLDYSTSFSKSSSLFPKAIQSHIYAIYGLVRIADEVVDTYRGQDADQLLHDFEQETYAALKRGYSTNPVIHAFALTARQFHIKPVLIKPFFKSMAMDLHPKEYSAKKYEEYIYGSAEVIGLMCLKVFVDGSEEQYSQLKEGARSLGSAYQKVNFLRDLAADYKELGRLYFPGVTFESFDEKAKNKIIKDIKKDFKAAQVSVAQLPNGSRRAVELSVLYYTELLTILERTSAEVIKQKRVRVANSKKLQLYWKSLLRKNVQHVS